MAVIQTNLSCELQNGSVRVQYLDGVLFSQDNQANQINVAVYNGGEPAELSGNVTANIIRADGCTVTATGGTITGNVASISLPAVAYAIPGIISVIVKLSSNESTTTLAAFVATMYESATDKAVDPGTIIPSVQALIDAINAAVASIPPDYSTLSAQVNTNTGNISTLQTDTSDLPTMRQGITDNATDIDNLETDVARKANVDGSYEGMTVGNAEQLVSTVGITDKVPYNFRTSGGNADIGDREEDVVVGGSVVWNQLIDGGNFDDASKYNPSSGELTVYNNVGTLTLSSDSNAARIERRGLNILNGHKYFFTVTINPSKSTNIMIQMSGGGNSQTIITSSASASKATFAVVANALYNLEVIRLYINRSSSMGENDTVTFENFMFIDLTQMFGSTIADYVNSLETATPGAGIAWFRKLFPKAYYPYNAGELMHVQTSAHEMTGFNQWDEEWEVGGIDSSTGANNSQSNAIRSKNYTPCLPGTSYFFKCPWANTVRTRFYDANKNYIGYVDNSGNAVLVNSVFVTPANCYYMRFMSPDSFGTTYNNDICINLSWDGERDGEYEPYILHSYPLDDSLTLRGIPKLDSNNALYYDGDVYAPDGTVTRRFGIVDLGTLSWGRGNGYGGYFYTTGVADIAYPNGNIVTNKINALTTRYELAMRADLVAEKEKIICGDGTTTKVTQIQIRDTAYSTAADLKASLSGVYLVYELATPTTETADHYQTPQVVNNWGTEQYVDAGTRDVEIPVGHETLYRADLRAKLESAPESPEGNGDYIVRQTNGENSYVPLVIPNELPANPTENGTYVLRATVANGATVLSWVAQ